MKTLFDARGKTVKMVEIIRAEHGRTYNKYLCFTFTDGTRIMLGSFGPEEPHSAEPPIEEMKKAPCFFSADDIANRVRCDETETRRRRKELLQHKRYELERLKKELGEEASK